MTNSKFEVRFANLLDTDVGFFAFIHDEFERTTRSATIEELVDFAFGSIQAAIEAYEPNEI